MADVAHILPRCQRCGYGLRLVRGYWWCDVCRLPLISQRGPSVRELFRAAGDSLRRFLLPPPRRRQILTYPPRSQPTVVPSAMTARCPSCGSLTPRDVSSCVHCGTVFGEPAETPVPAAATPSQPVQHDDAVYRYIVENRGEISLSKGSADLGIAVSELQASIRRLENSGKIMRDRA